MLDGTSLEEELSFRVPPVQNAQSPARALPPIVLLVDEDADALGEYSTVFEVSGMWVATAMQPSEWMDVVDELRLDATQALRDRVKGGRQRTAELRACSQRLRETTAVMSATLARQRSCPDCGSRLEWIERGRIGGTTYDYYRWCLKGCGLYCFDRDAQRWVKLA